MNRYRVTGSLPVHLPDTAHEPGDEFDYEYDEETERALVSAGRVEIVPATYLVVGDSVVHDTQPGATFDAALPVGVEALLVAGGHIERQADPERESDDVDDEAEPSKPRRRTRRTPTEPEE